MRARFKGSLGRAESEYPVRKLCTP